MTRLLREVRRFLVNYPGPGVVAVSGGADSVALVRALAACHKHAFTVAHVNHCLRGAESDADEAFVRELAATLGVECRVKSVNVASLGGNLESTARRVRYDFFADVAADVSANWIATGHTADDQAETVLHRILRGTGVQGFRGIAACGFAGKPPAKPQAAPRIRPLLTVTRADVLAHLAELAQPYRDDSSNADPRFTRNRIRRELLPLLRTFNPEITSALARLAEHAADAHEIITLHAATVLARAERPRVGGTLVLDVADLGASPAVIRAVLRHLWEREAWPLDQMDADAWDRACDVASDRLPAWDFPGGITMRRAGRVVQLQSSRFQVPGSKSDS